MRTLSPVAIAALAASETERVFIVLLTFDHDSLYDQIRLSTDPTVRVDDENLLYKTVSRGLDYMFVPMEVMIPNDEEDTPTQASLRLANPGRELIPFLRSITTPPSVTMEIVLDDDPDSPILTFPTFQLTSIQFDASVITLGLTINNREAEGYPGLSFTPGFFPALT